MPTKQNKPNQIAFYFSIVIVAIASVFYVNGLILAWTAPSASPPGSNVSTPLNTGSTNQTKNAGLSLDGSTYGLWADGTSYGVYGQDSDGGAYGYLGVADGYGGYFIGKYGAYVHDSDHGTNAYLAHQGYGIHSNGIIRGSYFMDHNNTGYYVDPASVSYLNDVRANIIYDRQNTGYYVDPASTSKFKTINLGGVSKSSWPEGGTGPPGPPGPTGPAGGLSFVTHSGRGCASCPCGYKQGHRGAPSVCNTSCGGHICRKPTNPCASWNGFSYNSDNWAMECIE